MKTILLVILCFFITQPVFSQAFVWEKTISTTSNSIATDPNDNIIILGADGSFTQLTKYTKDGVLIWSKRLSKAGAHTPSGSVVVDKHGNICTFTDGFDSINSVFTGIRPFGITKFSPNGNLIWHVNYTSTGPCPACLQGPGTRLNLQIDENDDLYAGYFLFDVFAAYTYTLGTTTIPAATANNYILSIGSVTSAGTVKWLKAMPFNKTFVSGQASVSTLSIAGNKLITGGYMGKYSLAVNGTTNISVDRCSAWMAAFDCSNGEYSWSRTHNLFYYCTGTVCNCYSPSLNTNSYAGQVALTNYLNGAFVFRPLDTIAATHNFGESTVKPYYTIYDTNGNPIKGKIIELATSGYSGAGNITGARNNYYYMRNGGNLLKVDTGFNLVWSTLLPPNSGAPDDRIFIPPHSNDIIATYTRAGVVYLGKLIDSAGVISGKTYADWNNDGIFTPGIDSSLTNILINTAYPVIPALSSPDSGKYHMYVAPGSYLLAAHFSNPFYLFLPIIHSVTINQLGDTITGKDFRLRPWLNFTDVSANISALGIARSGAFSNYAITVKNFSPAPTPIDVGLKLPALASYNSISGASATVNAPDSVTISFGAVNPFQTKTAIVKLQISPAAVLGDTLHYYIKADPFISDTIKSNNIDSLAQPVRASYDPNEKEVNSIKREWADRNNRLEYIIHFQNTGNDTAFYVRVADTLSSKLDVRTFNLIDASHPLTAEIKGNIINFIFNPIALPDSTTNEPASHGYVKYSMQPVAFISPLDTIFNRAGIYFDFNAPVITNTVKTWLITGPPVPVILKSFVAQKNSNTVTLKFETASEPGFSKFIIERSTDGLNYTAITSIAARGTDYSGSSYITEDLQPSKNVNYYRLKMVDKDGRFSYSWIVIADFNDNKSPVKIFPNPVSGDLYINFDNPAGNEIYSCRLVNSQGQLVWSGEINTASTSTRSINSRPFANGIYFLTLKNERTAIRQKIIIKH